MTYDFTFVDLFAGIGGFHVALKDLGGECVFASEWDEHAQKTYEANHGLKPVGDITQVDPSSIPKHTVLTAGFPCQPFSIAGVTKANALGRHHGFKHPTQGTLFFNVKEIIAETRPEAFILENVKNLVGHDKGRTFKVILDTLENELGYKVTYKVLDAQPVVPQHRERIFIVGFRDKKISYAVPELTGDSPKLGTVLEKGEIDPKYTLTPNLWEYLQKYAAKHKRAGNGFGFGLVTPESVARTLSARYYKDGAEILVAQPRKRPRRLTPRECARLMGYPTDFKIPVSDWRAYRQFGNSVVVPVVKHVAASVLEALETSRLKRAS
ncbi:MAG: DNA (cytosine-5-)-methyltransferase [Myxococcaceae bacterium]|nr:DNA (cytosine-5-)-methyltransferase [Myxococcaceae bacterium]